jgi:hypothetical protein
MLTLTGLILIHFGIATRGNVELYAEIPGINANLWWELLLLVFWLSMFLSRRRIQTDLEKDPPPPSEDGEVRRGY